MDKVALRTWGTFEDIGMYSAASKIVRVAIVIQSAFTTFGFLQCTGGMKIMLLLEIMK